MKSNSRRVGSQQPLETGPSLGWRAGLFVALVLMTVIMTGLGLYQVNESYGIARLGHGLEQSRLTMRDLVEEDKRLRIRIDAHKHPNQVLRKARNLNMRHARPSDEFYVPSEAREGWPRDDAPGPPGDGDGTP